MKYATALLLLLALVVSYLAATPLALASAGMSSIAGSPEPSAGLVRKGPRHPLDPLSAAEIAATTRLLKADSRTPEGAFFPTLVLHEPPKEDVLAFKPGKAFSREAYVEVFDRPNNVLYKAIVDLRANRVISFEQLPAGTQPTTFFTEFDDVNNLVSQDKEWIAAMDRRGVDPKDVYIDIWAGGDTPITKDRDGNPVPAGTRLMRAIAFFQGDMPNPYDRPIEGVMAIVDANHMRVLQVTDTGIRPVSHDTGDAAPNAKAEPLKPLQVIQRQGPSFKVDGNEVSWQNWRFRFALHPREGLVLYTVGFAQDGKVRPVAYRIGLSEVFVPYGLPDPNWAWRAAFDIGDYGIGRTADPLAANVDVPDNAVFFDATLADDVGESYVIPKAMALYERDSGVLWKRVDPTSEDQETRMGRELVLTFNSWIGNYIYGVDYIFRLDGTLEVRAVATGTTLNRGVQTLDEGNQYGTAVTTQVAAPNHQHFLNFRLDLDVDGTANRVVETNVSSVPTEYGNAWAGEHTLLKTEDAAQRDLNPATARTWTVESTDAKNAVGHETGYALIPVESMGMPYAAATNPPLLRAGYTQHALWVTSYKPDEMYAAGPFPNQSLAEGQGLPQYANGESVADKDIVLWYTIPFTHVPEVEEYPVMNSESLGFMLRPDGFFSRNPALGATKSKP